MASLVGRRVWEGGQDDSGYRDFQIVWRIRTTRTEGPSSVLSCPGLPIEGSPWIFDDDVEPSIWCRPKMSVKQVVAEEGDPCLLWDLTQTFSNKPPPKDQQQGCQDQHPEDPLLEPQKVSGNFQKFQEEATYDRFLLPIQTSSHEQIRGPQNEWDSNRPTIQIVQNVLNLELDVFAPMIDTVNMFTLWGLLPRCIKLSDVAWTKNYYGQCYAYYTRTLSFDVNYNTFDRVVLDEGTKVLHGHWEDSGWILDDIDGEPPDATNPSHFDRFKDRNGENCRVVLNGFGIPSGVHVGTSTSSSIESTGQILIQKYSESDFLLLGIPATF